MPPTTEKETNVQKPEEKKPSDPKKKKNEKEKEELSEEDLAKKAELELLVERAQDTEIGVQKLALETLRTEIRTSTSSMTSVPKPLKFLRPQYSKLKEVFEKYSEGENKKLLADVLSVLAMTMGKSGARESLHFTLRGSLDNIGSWGHEFVRNLAGEIGHEFQDRQQNEKPVEDLNRLIEEIVPYDMKHNAEHEACDLLMEVEQIDKVVPFVDENNYSRVCLYLSNCATYVPEPEDSQILKVTYDIYKKMKQYPDSLRIAMRLNDMTLVKDTWESCEDKLVRKQLSFMLGRQRIYLEGEEESDIMNNSNLSEYFLALGQDLKIMDAKTPEDIYKTNLSETRTFTANVDSARQNLASTFVNAFVNAGFGQDKLMTPTDASWLYKNKEHGMMSAAASLGMILLWDVDGGLSVIDRFLYSTDENIKAGALLAVGIVNSGVRNEIDPAVALLSDYINAPNNSMRIGAILGLGLAYAGSNREDLGQLISPVLEDSSAPMEVIGIAALALGLIFVGTANPDMTQLLCVTLMERDETSLNVTHSRFICLALGLLYLGKQQMAEVPVETLKTITHPIGQYATLAVDSCAYAGTGNVLKVQKLLDICGDHLEDKNGHQAVAVLGIALVAMGEEIGTDMAIRAFEHLLQYGEPVIRRAIPLALGFLSISFPRVNVMDTLSKLSHDSDEEVAWGAIFGLGLIGAGTNNSRIAGMLRSLATYYYKEPNHLFLVRMAQGLVFLGKGTMTLAPYHSDRTLLSPVAVAGLLTVLHSCLDFKNIVLSKSHYLLYSLVEAIYPRMLMTFDENLKPLPVPVRVGQAVDTIGQAGRPKTITGFQTHTTPVLLGYNDRAELATDEYLPTTSVLEGFVILKPNPDFKPITEPTKKK